MQTHSKIRQVSPRGVALVLVLSILVLVTVLVIAFFSMVTGELTNSKAYAGGAQAKQLSDSVVQIVMSQIKNATTSGTNPRLTWASQPGMIRTFDDTSKPGSFYKLYSSPQMIVAGSPTYTTPAREIPPYSEWSSKPALYTDLNQPVLVRDPAGLIVPDASDAQATYTANYPILDPGAVGNVEGFNIFNATSAPPTGYTAAPTGYAGTYPPAGLYNPVAKPNPAPMPTQWLYVLQSGAFAVPDDVNASTGALTFLSSAAPSAANPIVGRVAFWTDDETCKLNINTASEGTCFDVPRATVLNELQMVKGMPVQNEYQRMPGHPAMTCLSPALGWIAGLQHTIAPADTTLFTATTYPVAKAYYDLTPRVNYMSKTTSGSSTQDRTSQAGTMDMTTVAYDANSAVLPDGDRLYASLDELVFNSNANARRSNPQVQGATTSPVITKPALEQAKFFLTASSRAPETTLFNTPRIGLWPLQRTTTVRDAKDKLLEFCTELGANSATNTPYRYHFQRYNEGKTMGWGAVDGWSGTTVTQIPSCMSSTCDYTQIPRNQQLYKYLQYLTKQKIPGYGGDFVTKWTKPGRDQVLTEIFDFIRSGLAQTASGLASAVPTDGYQYPMFTSNTRSERFVVPILIDTTSDPDGGAKTKGFGRFHTVVQAAIVFYASGAQNAATAPDQPPYLPMQTNQMQAVLMLMPFQPMPGMYNWAPFCRYEAKFNGGFNLSVNGGGSSAFADSSTRICLKMGGNAGIGCVFPLFGMWNEFQPSGMSTASPAPAIKNMNPGSANEDDDFPFCTQFVNVPIPTTPGVVSTFNFSGGTLTLKIRGGAGPLANSEVYQTITMMFPPLTNLPVPQRMTNAQTTQTWQDRIGNPNGNPATSILGGYNFRGIIKEGDIVRAVEVDPTGPSKGDLRLIAGMPDIPATYFRVHPEYTTPPQPYVSTQLDYNVNATSPTYATVANLSGSNMTALAAARFGRYAHSLRSTGYNDGDADYQYGIGNTAKNVGGANRNNLTVGGYTNDKIDSKPTTASTMQGSGATTIGIPNSGGLVAGIIYSNKDTPVAAHGTTAALMSNNKPGDWDSGAGGCPDGPYINKPDPGNLNWGEGFGYWTSTTSDPDASASYSPNRQAPSPVMFGSLPTPTSTGAPAPWQTLLFCPNPASGGSSPATDHYGFGILGTTPADYLMLDLFTMPVVEPYAISEPLSTAGKVNLNYQIQPFNFIRRDTAVRGVLKSMQMGAIPNIVTSHTTSAETRYKLYNATDPTIATGLNSSVQTRFNLNLDETNGTLAGFEKKFATKDVFRSAAEICSVFLVPMGPVTNATYTTVSNVTAGWWKGYKLTGDNLREAPYSQIYPRVTTKSNTFTVHYRVQVLQKVPATAANVWIESKDQVLSEYRGSTLIERYVDPSDPRLPDFAADPMNVPTLDDFYQMRIISNKKF